MKPIEFPVENTAMSGFMDKSLPDFETTTLVSKGQDVGAVQGMGTPELVEFGSKVTHDHPEEDFRWNQKVLPASEFPGDYQKPKP